MVRYASGSRKWFLVGVLGQNANGEFKMRNVVKFLKDESGATAIEYGLIAALVGVAIIATVSALGDSLVAVFAEVSSELDKAVE